MSGNGRGRVSGEARIIVKLDSLVCELGPPVYTGTLLNRLGPVTTTQVAVVTGSPLR